MLTFTLNVSADDSQDAFLQIQIECKEDARLLFVEEAHSKWINDFCLASGFEEFETESHAGFSITRFTYKDVVCLLTIDNLSESAWISAATRANIILNGLKNELQSKFI